MTIVVPSNYKCRKTDEVMVRPTTTACGHNFEFSIIKSLWEANHGATCPCCNRPLGNEPPVINEPLRLEIKVFRDACRKQAAQGVLSGRPATRPSPLASTARPVPPPTTGVVITRTALEENPRAVVFGAAARLVAANIGSIEFAGASERVQADLNRALSEASRGLDRMARRS